MPVVINLKTVGSHLAVITNQLLLYFFHIENNKILKKRFLFLKIEKIISFVIN